MDFAVCPRTYNILCTRNPSISNPKGEPSQFSSGVEFPSTFAQNWSSRGSNSTYQCLITIQFSQGSSKQCNESLLLISGLPSLISYVPGTGPQALFGDASLSICPKTSCEAESIEVINATMVGSKNLPKKCHIIVYWNCNCLAKIHPCGVFFSNVETFKGKKLCKIWQALLWTRNNIFDKLK